MEKSHTDTGLEETTPLNVYMLHTYIRNIFIHTVTYVNILERGHNTNILPPQLTAMTSIQNDASKLRFAKLDLLKTSGVQSHSENTRVANSSFSATDTASLRSSSERWGVVQETAPQPTPWQATLFTRLLL